MKIAYLIDKLHSINAGTERQLYRLIQGMKLRGHEVKLFYLRESDFTRALGGDFICEYENLDIRSILRKDTVSKLLAFRNNILSHRYDVVHVFFNDSAIVMPAALAFSRVKLFSSRRDMGIWYTGGKLLLLRLMCRSRVRIICNSKAVADYTSRKEWKRAKYINVIYNGMDEYQNETTPETPDWLDKVAADSSPVKAVLLANVRPVKNLEDLLHAAALLARQGIDMSYYVIGSLSDEPYVAGLKALIRELKLESRIHFLGRVSEARDLLNHFDVGLLTSHSEGLSNSIMEYLCCGLPVVASDVGGNPELVQDGENGFLYPVGDPQALADRLKRLYSDRACHERFSDNAVKSIEKFTMKTMLEEHERLYQM